MWPAGPVLTPAAARAKGAVRGSRPMALRTLSKPPNVWVNKTCNRKHNIRYKINCNTSKQEAAYATVFEV